MLINWVPQQYIHLLDLSVCKEAGILQVLRQLEVHTGWIGDYAYAPQ